MTFEVEITRFFPEPGTVRTRVETVGDAEAVVRAGAGEIECVLVAQGDGDRSADEFYDLQRGGRIWVARGRALVWRDAHREWYATDPTDAVAGRGEVFFVIQTARRFRAGYRDRFALQGFDALALWLRTGEMLPSLTWG